MRKLHSKPHTAAYHNQPIEKDMPDHLRCSGRGYERIQRRKSNLKTRYNRIPRPINQTSDAQREVAIAYSRRKALFFSDTRESANADSKARGAEN